MAVPPVDCNVARVLPERRAAVYHGHPDDLLFDEVLLRAQHVSRRSACLRKGTDTSAWITDHSNHLHCCYHTRGKTQQAWQARKMAKC
jgi:hypothetical protein